MTDHQHTADVLNRAADLIEERGWTQGPNGWLGPYGEGVYCWNDHPDRTAAEVIEVLRAAAAIEQGRADAVDTAAAQKSRMIAVAGEAAARTLAAL